MSPVQLRCMVSGVSLVGSEVAVFLVVRHLGRFVPFTLPIWGTYDGLNMISETQEGPNSALVLREFCRAQSEGRIQVDWVTLGIEKFELTAIEDLFTLLGCAQLHAPDALKWDGQTMSFSFVSAHVAAALMDGEPALVAESCLEDLAGIVFSEVGLPRFYQTVQREGLKTRCKFGLSMIASAAFQVSLDEREIEWQEPQFLTDAGEEDAAAWLLAAMSQFAEDAVMIDALGEHSFAAQGSEAEESMDVHSEAERK